MSKAVARARERLYDSVEQLAHARANASWLNGYRAGGKDTEDARERERKTWNLISNRIRPDVDRAVKAYTRAVRAEVRDE